MIANSSPGTFARRHYMPAVLFVVMSLLSAGCSKTASRTEVVGNSSGPIQEAAIPHSLVAEHENLLREVKETIALGGETGKFAKLVEDALVLHVVKEEEYAFHL